MRLRRLPSWLVEAKDLEGQLKFTYNRISEFGQALREAGDREARRRRFEIAEATFQAVVADVNAWGRSVPIPENVSIRHLIPRRAYGMALGRQVESLRLMLLAAALVSSQADESDEPFLLDIGCSASGIFDDNASWVDIIPSMKVGDLVEVDRHEERLQRSFDLFMKCLPRLQQIEQRTLGTVAGP